MTHTIESTDTLSCDGCLEAIGVDYGSTLDRVDLTDVAYLIDGEVFCLPCAENVTTYLPSELEGSVQYWELGIGN